MHEQVATAVIGRDEPEALVVAEPLDGTRCHENPFVFPVVQAKARLDPRETYQGQSRNGRILCAYRALKLACSGPWSGNERTAPADEVTRRAHRSWCASAAISSGS